MTTKEIKECQYCYKRVGDMQLYLVFSRKLNRTMQLCPSCIKNWNVNEIKEAHIPESIMRAVGKDKTEIKKMLESWNISLLDV